MRFRNCSSRFIRASFDYRSRTSLIFSLWTSRSFVAFSYYKQWAVDRIEASAGQINVDELARQTGYTRKHLNMLFQRQVGLGAKALARVHRFKSALSLLGTRFEVPWAELAQHCGYYDQSHLVRDFKGFSGYAPSEFLRRARPDSGSVVVR